MCIIFEAMCARVEPICAGVERILLLNRFFGRTASALTRRFAALSGSRIAHFKTLIHTFVNITTKL